MKLRGLIGFVVIALLISLTSCKNKKEEHGEESGKQYTKAQTYKKVRGGVKLELKYDEAAEAFVGTMENVSKEVAERARVEVHLSNGVELGPTESGNLKSGEKVKVTLSAKGQKFEKWNCHAEVGSDEHSHGEDGEHSHGEESEHSSGGVDGEHGGEHSGEHGGEPEGEHGGEHGGEHSNG